MKLPKTWLTPQRHATPAPATIAEPGTVVYPPTEDHVYEIAGYHSFHKREEHRLRRTHVLQKVSGYFFLKSDFCRSATDSTSSPMAMTANPAWLTPTYEPWEKEEKHRAAGKVEAPLDRSIPPLMLWIHQHNSPLVHCP